MLSRRFRNRYKIIRCLNKTYKGQQTPRHPWILRNFTHEVLVGFVTIKGKSYVELDNPRFLR